MSEIKSQAPVRPNFDRRSVVKGAAWSVPVIAAAVAAPLAAASAGSAWVAFATATPATFVNTTTGKNRGPRAGTAAHSFTLSNTTPGDITGTIQGTITIQPATGDRSVGITTITDPSGQTTSSGGFSGTMTYSGIFTYTGTVLGGTDLVFSINGFTYQGTDNGPGGTFTMTVTLTLPGGRKISTESIITMN